MLPSWGCDSSLAKGGRFLPWCLMACYSTELMASNYAKGKHSIPVAICNSRTSVLKLQGAETI